MINQTLEINNNQNLQLENQSEKAENIQQKTNSSKKSKIKKKKQSTDETELLNPINSEISDEKYDQEKEITKDHSQENEDTKILSKSQKKKLKEKNKKQKILTQNVENDTSDQGQQSSNKIDEVKIEIDEDTKQIDEDIKQIDEDIKQILEVTKEIDVINEKELQEKQQSKIQDIYQNLENEPLIEQSKDDVQDVSKEKNQKSNKKKNKKSKSKRNSQDIDLSNDQNQQEINTQIQEKQFENNQEKTIQSEQNLKVDNIVTTELNQIPQTLQVNQIEEEILEQTVESIQFSKQTTIEFKEQTDLFKFNQNDQLVQSPILSMQNIQENSKYTDLIQIDLSNDQKNEQVLQNEQEQKIEQEQELQQDHNKFEELRIQVQQYVSDLVGKQFKSARKDDEQIQEQIKIQNQNLVQTSNIKIQTPKNKIITPQNLFTTPKNKVQTPKNKIQTPRNIKKDTEQQTDQLKKENTTKLLDKKVTILKNLNQNLQNQNNIKDVHQNIDSKRISGTLKKQIKLSIEISHDEQSQKTQSSATKSLKIDQKKEITKKAKEIRQPMKEKKWLSKSSHTRQTQKIVPKRQYNELFCNNFVNVLNMILKSVAFKKRKLFFSEYRLRNLLNDQQKDLEKKRLSSVDKLKNVASYMIRKDLKMKTKIFNYLFKNHRIQNTSCLNKKLDKKIEIKEEKSLNLTLRNKSFSARSLTQLSYDKNTQNPDRLSKVSYEIPFFNSKKITVQATKSEKPILNVRKSTPINQYSYVKSKFLQNFQSERSIEKLRSISLLETQQKTITPKIESSKKLFFFENVIMEEKDSKNHQILRKVDEQNKRESIVLIQKLKDMKNKDIKNQDQKKKKDVMKTNVSLGIKRMSVPTQI